MAKMKNTAVFEEISYLDFLGLAHHPFPIAPDDDNFYVSENIEQILSEIVHGIMSRKGFMVLTGDIGLGKTTISRKIMNILEQKGVETSLVFHTSFQDVELIQEINRDFGLKTESLHFNKQMRCLNDFLLEQNRRGKNCAIIIDDAQNLSVKSLELVRMISNLESDQQKLVQILLVGQTELMGMLNSKKLRQLKSRIVISKEVSPLTREELKNYLFFKLNMAGSRGQITFQEAAIKKIYQFSKGNLRQINILMDRCFYVMLLYNTIKISRQIVQEACSDLNPNRSEAKKRPVFLALSALLFLCLIGLFTYSAALSPPRSAPMTIIKKIEPEHTTIKGETEHSHLSRLHGQSTDTNTKNAEQTVSISESVSGFLKAYELSRFENSFVEALKRSQSKEIDETIFDQTGLKLIRLNHIPDHIGSVYSILKHTSIQGHNENLFLFWHPLLLIKKFYYYYEGEEILNLQKIFAKINLYSGPLDGIVGKNLMLAVVSFQKQAGLPVTGYPDENTIFLLFHEPENKANGTQK
jgi:general secretion pathway protein A